MDQRSAMDKDTEVDLESGMPLIGDDSVEVSTPDTLKQGKTLLSKISGGFVRGSVNTEDRPSLHNESNLRQVYMDVVEVANKPMMGQDSVRRAEKSLGKEKRKKASNKKAEKPPRPPQAPTLDAADHKLIREISELAMLKRARVERMKALKKMKAAKSSPSSNSSTWAMIFTVVFFIVIIIQGLSSGKSSVATFQGSPLSTSGTESGLISVQYQLNPSASDSNAPGSESHNRCGLMRQCGPNFRTLTNGIFISLVPRAIWVPQSVCNDIDRMTRNFIWGGDVNKRGLNLVRWETLTKHKRDGGLGLRDARTVNLSLLGKLVGQLLLRNDKLWCQVLQHKYLGDKMVFFATHKSSVSVVWRSVLKASPAFMDGFSLQLGSGNKSFWYDNWIGCGRLCNMVDFVNISDTMLIVKDLWKDGSWDFNSLYTELPQPVIDVIFTVVIPDVSEVEDDRWVWDHHATGTYNASSGYRWLNAPNTATLDRKWKWLWSLKIPEKVKFMSWLALHDSLPSRSLLFNRSISISAGCGRCNNDVEDLFHVLRDCPYSVSVWHRLGFFSTDFWSPHTFASWFLRNASSNNGYLFLAGLWWVWRWRNNSLLDNSPWNISQVIANVYHDYCDWKMMLKDAKIEGNIATSSYGSWSVPGFGWTKFNIDGSCSYNHHMMGGGGVLRDHDGTWLLGFSANYGAGTAVLAELLALRDSLKCAWTLGYRNMVIECDSLEVVQMINDNLPICFSNVASLVRDIRVWLANQWIVELHFVARENNMVADFMAKVGNHGNVDFQVWNTPPPGAIDLLDKDLLFLS